MDVTSDMTGSRLLERRRMARKSPIFSAVGTDVTQNVPQDFSYLAFCRNGVETWCTFCVTSCKMYSQPWRSNKLVPLCEFLALITHWLTMDCMSYIFGVHTFFFGVLSVEKCVFVLLGSLYYITQMYAHFPKMSNCNKLQNIGLFVNNRMSTFVLYMNIWHTLKFVSTYFYVYLCDYAGAPVSIKFKIPRGSNEQKTT
jgi:hypothetical protein